MKVVAYVARRSAATDDRQAGVAATRLTAWTSRCPNRKRGWRETSSVTRRSMFEFAGGEPAFLALATAHHQRCLEDPVLSHPFEHPENPEHIARLADHWAEVFG